MRNLGGCEEVQEAEGCGPQRLRRRQAVVAAEGYQKRAGVRKRFRHRCATSTSNSHRWWWWWWWWLQKQGNGLRGLLVITIWLLSLVAVDCLFTCVDESVKQIISLRESKSSPYPSYQFLCHKADNRSLHQPPRQRRPHSGARPAAASWSSDGTTATPLIPSPLSRPV